MFHNLLLQLICRILWKPIATAPRDGTVIDLWHKSGFVVRDQWWDEGWVGCWQPDTEFTHWSPITSPLGVLRAVIDADDDDSMPHDLEL